MHPIGSLARTRHIVTPWRLHTIGQDAKQKKFLKAELWAYVTALQRLDFIAIYATTADGANAKHRAASSSPNPSARAGSILALPGGTVAL